MEIISRNKYIDRILPFVDKPVIKVLTGMRRVGKSSVLLKIIEDLQEKNKKILFVNKESLARDHIKEYKDLYAVAKEYDYVFVDEVQNIGEREKAILSLHGEGKDVYITGSNSNLLAGELSTNLRGRYVKFDIFPLDYKEFLQFHKLDANKESFEKYTIFGGMPFLIHLTFEESITGEYLKSICETILLKDIVERFSIRNVAIFHKLVLYVARNIGTIFSSVSIANFLKKEKISLSPTTILSYLSNLKQAYLFHEVSRYDIKGKKLFEVRQKYYWTDWGMRNAFMGGFQKIDIGQVLENIVYLNLIANGREVKIGEFIGKEVDFVCTKGNDTMYIQVTYLVETEETKQREFSPLLEIQDNYPKYVLSTDLGASGNVEGVQRKNIGDFLSTL